MRGVVDRSADAVFYDPDSGTWAPLTPMPEPRAGGAAVTRADGSVLLVGGQAEKPNQGEECGSGTTGSATTVRFVPLP